MNLPVQVGHSAVAHLVAQRAVPTKVEFLLNEHGFLRLAYSSEFSLSPQLRANVKIFWGLNKHFIVIFYRILQSQKE
jgi:hypothetical protein